MTFKTNGFGNNTFGNNTFGNNSNFGNNATNTDKLELDSIIMDEPKEFSFVLLKPGEYPFTVKNTRVEVHQGNGAMNGYQKIVLELEVHGVDHDGNNATAFINDNLFLSQKAGWKIAAFLASTGLKKHGEPTSPQKALNSVGSNGTVRVENQEAMNGKTDDQGNVLLYNAIASYVVPSNYYGK